MSQSTSAPPSLDGTPDAPPETRPASRQLSIPASLLTRIGLVLTGIALLSLAGTIGGSLPGSAPAQKYAILSLICYPIALGVLIMGVLPRVSPRAPVYLITAVSIVYLAFFFSVLDRFTGIYSTDVMAFTHTSADMLLEGENPYQVRDREVLAQSARDHGFILPINVTKQMDGQTVDWLFIYPAGHLYPYAIAAAIGLEDLRWVNVITTLLIMLILWKAAPAPLKTLAPLGVLASMEVGYAHIFGGITDSLWVGPLMLCALALNRRSFDGAALAYGCAMAMKQQPWLLAPFLAIWLWKELSEQEPRERLVSLVRFGAISGVTFLAINLPFIVWDPKAWFSAVTFPFRGDLIYDGTGFVMLTTSSILHLGKTVYSILSLAVLAGLAVAFYRCYPSLRYTFWVYPGLVFWFAHRSFSTYFLYWLPLLLLAVFMIWREQLGDDSETLLTSSDSGVRRT